jgi:hypothetical protein
MKPSQGFILSRVGARGTEEFFEARKLESTNGDPPAI